ncbi:MULTISPECIES: hypothetical protein [Loigolactobacillus]|nr:MULTISPECIES: hypothetical protein [Loigolactobacillus]MDA5387364.1 hypothetical protein [Loigolactobacillus backii]MDA5389903.1 hypothetical protein [Loigolactobacillus backii]
MAQNNHTGVGNNRRPTNHKNRDKKAKSTKAVLDFLKEREAQESK